MRITPAQILAVKQVCEQTLTTRPFQIFLYGSRTEDHLKGGDFDFYLLSLQWSQEDLDKINLLLARLKSHKEIGDQKINLSLITDLELQNDAFWSSIKKAVLIA
jgi:hypothetical protein